MSATPWFVVDLNIWCFKKFRFTDVTLSSFGLYLPLRVAWLFFLTQDTFRCAGKLERLSVLQ